MLINQKIGRQTFRRRFVSLLVLPCPPECYLQRETKIEPDLRLRSQLRFSLLSIIITISSNEPWSTESTKRIEIHQSQTMTFWTRWTKLLFPKRCAKMIDGSENWLLNVRIQVFMKSAVIFAIFREYPVPSIDNIFVSWVHAIEINIFQTINQYFIVYRLVSEWKRHVVIEQTRFLSTVFLCSEFKWENIYSRLKFNCTNVKWKLNHTPRLLNRACVLLFWEAKLLYVRFWQATSASNSKLYSYNTSMGNSKFNVWDASRLVFLIFYLLFIIFLATSKGSKHGSSCRG